jgi:hypothetical protein
MGWGRRGTNLVAVLMNITMSGCGSSGGGAGSNTGTGVPAITATPPPVPLPTPTPSTPAPPPNASSDQTMTAQNWEIGPVINGRNYSVGMPLNPVQTPDGWAFDFPLSPGSAHYVTFPFGSLAGKTRIVMHYRIEADPGVQIVPVCCSTSPAIGPTLYFQQQGDDWNTDGMRWWATFDTKSPMVSGDYEVTIPLDGAWTSVMTMTAQSNPQQFITAKSNAGRVGFTLGGGDGFGHGVYATGRARLVVTEFNVE